MVYSGLKGLSWFLKGVSWFIRVYNCLSWFIMVYTGL